MVNRCRKHTDAVRAALARAEPPDISGWHGTSVWALLAAARFGHLPNRTVRDPAFYYLPVARPDARSEAESYAADNAKIHFVRELLDLDSIDTFYEEVEKDNLDVAATVEHVQAEGELCGIVLGLARDAADLPTLDAPPGEVCIQVPRGGLPVRLIAFAEALGPDDRAILSDHGLL